MSRRSHKEGLFVVSKSGRIGRPARSPKGGIWVKNRATLTLPKGSKIVRYSDLALESDIQKAICDLLDYMRVPNSPTDAARVWSKSGEVRQSKVKPGWPDVSATISFGPHKGRSLYVETKAARTKYQPGQKETHAELRRAGAIVLVPRSLSEFAQMMIRAGVDHKLLREVL